MPMNRRSFFRSMGILAGTMALDPEQLLWKPTKKIFIPSEKTILALLEEKMAVAMATMSRMLAEEIYRPSPVFIALTSGGPGDIIEAELINPKLIWRPMEIGRNA